MLKDLSNHIYNEFYLNNSKEVQIKLKNNTLLKGLLIGYFKDGDETDELHILKWHIVDKKDAMNLGIDAFGTKTGNVINQKDIEDIKFSEDSI